MNNLREIVEATVRYRGRLYWHKGDVIEAALAAGQAASKFGRDAIIDAIEREITAREFQCEFDDPCDEMWPRAA